ncbi:ABC transporter ATP-binding protein [Actinomadura rugatobispora]|uniref:ABC transporter ATP-binding protein n=1 Tax=Actinomadura rugatobispora TaxID=1994 RepID=A0ABW0ZTL8_9ACTN|nr:ABC transporter ATP-binding protein [Actinomadura rugatobispora]
MRKRWAARRGSRRTAGDGPPPSASEEQLFGGRLLYDASWTRHDGDWFKLGARQSVAALPRLLGAAAGLAWRADRGAVLAVLAAELCRGAARAVGLLGVNAALAALLAGGTMDARLRSVIPIAVLLAAVAAVGAVCTAVSARFSEPLGPRVERLVRHSYLERSSRVEMVALEDHAFHRLLESAKLSAVSARRMVEQSVTVIGLLFSLAAMGGVLARLHWLLVLMLAVMVLPGMWATLTVARHRYESFHRWLQYDRAAGTVADLLTGTDAAAEVRVHDAGPFLLEHHRLMSEAEEAEQDRLARLTARLRITASSLTGLIAVATYGLLAGLLWSGALALAGAGTAVLAIRQGSTALENLVSRINVLHRESLHVADLRRFLAESARHLIRTGGGPLPRKVEAIRVRNLTFTYPGSPHPALHDVTLTVPTGRIVALVGENGSGKTTLAKLLCGLYLADTGSIHWDDVDAATADRAEIFARFALIQQDHVRWPMTAAVNVAISRTGHPVDERRLFSTAEDAGADFVDDLPHGWRTLLSRTFVRGVQLSGGQWQRLGIARGHYREADVLIVDEPTAALDAKAEEHTFNHIRAVADRGQTVVLITHRMASVQHADLVHVLHKGRLVESGTPHELLSDPDSRYRVLYDIQAAPFAHGPPRTGGRARRQESL